MDVNFPQEVEEVDMDNLIQQMVEYQNRSNMELGTDIDGFATSLTNSLMVYLNLCHPWLPPLQTGPHYQVAIRFFKDTALLLCEICDMRNITGYYCKTAIRTSSALDEIMSDCDDRNGNSTQKNVKKATLEMEALGNIRNTLDILKEIRLGRDRQYEKLALRIQKVIEVAKIAVAEPLPDAEEEQDAVLRTVKRAILTVFNYNFLLERLEEGDEVWQHAKKQDELLLEMVNKRMNSVEKLNNKEESNAANVRCFRLRNFFKLFCCN